MLSLRNANTKISFVLFFNKNIFELGDRSDKCPVVKTVSLQPAHARKTQGPGQAVYLV